MSRNHNPDPFYGSKAWKALRRQVLERDRYRCVLCGTDITGPRNSRVDHVIPRKVNKSLELVASNCRSLCVPCDLRHDAARPGSAGKAIKVGVDANGFPIGSDWS